MYVKTHSLHLNDAHCFISVRARCNDARTNRCIRWQSYYRVGHHFVAKLLSGIAAFGKPLASVTAFGGKATSGCIGKRWQCCHQQKINKIIFVFYVNH